MAVRVIVDVRCAIVRVLVGVQTSSEAAAQSPEANSNEQDTDKSFRPTGESLKGKHFTRDQGEQADEENTAGMAQAPAKANGNGLAPSVQGKRSNRGQVIRAGNDVDHSRGQTG